MFRQGYLFMGTNENLDVTHRLTVLGMNEVRIFTVQMEEILEHTKDKSWDGKNLGEGTETELAGKSDEERYSQQGKEYPPFLTPRGYEDGHKDRDDCQ